MLLLDVDNDDDKDDEDDDEDDEEDIDTILLFDTTTKGWQSLAMAQKRLFSKRIRTSSTTMNEFNDSVEG